MDSINEFIDVEQQEPVNRGAGVASLLIKSCMGKQLKVSCSQRCRANPGKMVEFLLFLSFQPTWHPSSFKSQFKHHFLREASLQAQPGPMLPLKTTLPCIYHSCRCICIWVIISLMFISSSGLSAPEKIGRLLYSSLNPKKLNIVEARLMCVG